jgi:site-specific recombinase XerC
LTKQGLPRPTEPAWRSYVEEWDRAQRGQNKPHTTRYNYELAVTQFTEFLAGPDLPAFLATTGMDPHDHSDAAQDPTDIDRKHIDWFITWMIDTRSAATAIIRLLLDSGGRLTEITTLPLESFNHSRDLVTVRGKSDRQRTIPFGNAPAKRSHAISEPGHDTPEQNCPICSSLHEDARR